MQLKNQVNHPFKGMVHLIYKLRLKAVFLCVKNNGAIRFGQKFDFLCLKCFSNSNK